MKDRIAKWYRMGLWSSDNVRDAVNKGILTEDEANEIINNK